MIRFEKDGCQNFFPVTLASVRYNPKLRETFFEQAFDQHILIGLGDAAKVIKNFT